MRAPLPLPLAAVALAIVLVGAQKPDPFHYSLSQAELRDLLAVDWESEAEAEESETHGENVHSFFRESNSQLILDLDLFSQFWKELEDIRANAADGDVDYVQELLTFFEPLREYDVSAPCLADIFHFLWTTYNYANTAKSARTCNDCNCTREYKRAFADYQWIFDVVDAIGKLPAAVGGGNNLWLGSWNTCRRISTVKNVQGQTWNGQYCMTRYYAYNKYNPLKTFGKNVDPTEVCRSNASSNFDDWPAEDRACFDIMPLLNVGVCVPDTCTDYDVKKIIEFLYSSVELSMDVKFVCNLTVTCSNDRAENKMYNDFNSMLVLCFVLVVFSLLIYGTCYDYYVVMPAEEERDRAFEAEMFLKRNSEAEAQHLEVQRNNSPAVSLKAAVDVPSAQQPLLSHPSNDDLPPPPLLAAPIGQGVSVNAPIGEGVQPSKKKPKPPPLKETQGVFVNILLMFSIRRNAQQIMDTSTNDEMIRCLHGARFLSMCWIIFGHTYYYICTSFTTDNLLVTLRNFPKIFYNQLVVQAPLAVDSFFFLSGLLTTFIFIKKLNNGSAKLGASVTWIAYYIRRYLRLTPVYLVIMILNVTLFTYISDGPFWRPVERNYCRSSWWVNLLYVNNFFKQDDQCMGWTWYMANDYQLHCFAPILIIALYRFKRWGVVFAAVLLVASSIINLVITLKHGYPPAPILSSSLDIVHVLDSYWVELYVKPYVRCVPYIVGAVVGYLLNVTNRQFEIAPLKLLLIWIVAAAMGAYSVFGLWHYTKTGEISTWWHIMYTLIGRPCFSIFLGWITFACETGNADKINRILGHKMWIPLSKMTFCAYLLHPLLLQLYYLSRNTAFHFTHSFQMFYMFSVAVCVSYSVAFVFCLAFEMPVTNFDKLIFQPPARKPKRVEGDNGTELVSIHTPTSNKAVPNKPIITDGQMPASPTK